jgi:hypothetical protein
MRSFSYFAALVLLVNAACDDSGGSGELILGACYHSCRTDLGRSFTCSTAPADDATCHSAAIAECGSEAKILRVEYVGTCEECGGSCAPSWYINRGCCFYSCASGLTVSTSTSWDGESCELAAAEGCDLWNSLPANQEFVPTCNECSESCVPAWWTGA